MFRFLLVLAAIAIGVMLWNDAPILSHALDRLDERAVWALLLPAVYIIGMGILKERD